MIYANAKENERGTQMKKLALRRHRKMIVTVLLILGALLSCFVVANYAESPQYHKKAIAFLDEKANVTLITAASATTSTLISMIPDDTASPIANEIADITSCFLVVLCAIYLEKYLLTLTGYFSFRILFPIAFILWAIYINVKREQLKNLAMKLVVFGIAIYVAVPMSVKISSLIEDTYQTSIAVTIENAKQSATEIQENAEDLAEEDEEGFFQGLINKIGGGVTGAVEKVKYMLNNFMEAAAIMMITSCVIPILVMVFLIWIVRVIWGINIKVPQISMKSRSSLDKEKMKCRVRRVKRNS